MVRLAGREKQGWKARFGESDWVDDSSWVDTDGDAPPDVEFLESEPSAYRLSNVDFERKSNETPLWARLLGLGAVGVILLALAIMSRPGGDPLAELPVADQEAIRDRQQGSADSSAADPSGAGIADSATGDDAVGDADDQPIDDESTAGEAATGAGGSEDGTVGAGPGETPVRELAPIPPVRDDLPPVPGVIFGFGLDSSIIRVDRTVDAPQEIPVPLSSRSRSESKSGHPFGSGFAVVDDGVLYGVGIDGDETRELTTGTRSLPADGGRIVVIAASDREQRVRIVSADGDSTRPAVDPAADPDADPSSDPDDDPVPGGWLIGRELDVLGAWGDRLLVAVANRVWLVDRAGRSSQVTSGRVLGFNGSHLVVLDCPDPTTCRIEVGPPDRPNRRSVPVPETLANLSVESWGTALDVSPDGDRLALRSIRGVVALPVVIDLLTGEEQSLPDSMNHSSSVAFSPDGQWLAYSFSDDIVIMNMEQRQRWRVFTERRIDQLKWLPSPELDAELATELAAEVERAAAEPETAPADEEEAAAVEDGVDG